MAGEAYSEGLQVTPVSQTSYIAYPKAPQTAMGTTFQLADVPRAAIIGWRACMIPGAQMLENQPLPLTSGRTVVSGHGEIVAWG